MFLSPVITTSAPTVVCSTDSLFHHLIQWGIRHWNRQFVALQFGKHLKICLCINQHLIGMSLKCWVMHKKDVNFNTLDIKMASNFWNQPPIWGWNFSFCLSYNHQEIHYSMKHLHHSLLLALGPNSLPYSNVRSICFKQGHRICSYMRTQYTTCLP
jgi:hypothetical protein